MQLTINNRKFDNDSIAELRQRLDEVDHETFSEIWLCQEIDGASICCLKNTDRCVLMFLRFPEDTGYATRSDEFGESNGVLEFKLSNGQIDEYPEVWTVAYERGKKALEYFYLTAEMDQGLIWNEG